MERKSKLKKGTEKLKVKKTHTQRIKKKTGAIL